MKIRRSAATIFMVVVALLFSSLMTSPARAASGPGLKAEYYTVNPDNNFSFEELKATVVERNLDIANMVPTYEQRTGQKENVGVRFSGSLVVPADAEYTFQATGDNGFRMWIDGQQLLDWWVNDWDKPQTTQAVSLIAGEHDFRFEQFQATGGANLHVSWKHDDSGFEIIPPEAFRLPADFNGFSADAAVDASGETLTATFAGELSGTPNAANFTLFVDGKPMPISAITTDGATLTVTPESPILTAVSVRLAYDGDGDLAIDGTKADAFDVPVVNTSTYEMATPWAKDMDPANPLPEYPRPLMERDAWANLNGTWEFTALAEGQSVGPQTNFDEKATVPFPIESALSGIGRHEDHFAYRRTFTVPADWRIGEGQRLLLQFGAVDYATEVFVNGTSVVTHSGGYDAFSADITDAVTQGENTIVVEVTDTTRNIPRGKQDANPSGIWYTPASGIWQTVWLEPVADNAITELELGSDLDASTITVTAKTPRSESVQVTVFDGDTQVAQASGTTRTTVAVPISEPKLWSPEDPHLYTLKVTAGGDEVSSYVGMRSIKVEKVNGVNRVLLNGQQTFLLSTLDQGYWPDGVYAAPTDEALAWDIRETKDFGFNTIRKHIKVEPARWYYHADTIGMLVWQDMPANNGGNATDESRATFDSELTRMVNQLDNVTSIIGWIPFNEGWGEWDKNATAERANLVKQLDPTRLVNAHSGVNCCNSHGDAGAGDIVDWHQYTGPAFPLPDDNRAAMDGEHGGFSLSIPGHVWPGGSVNPYGEVANSEELTAAYVENTRAMENPARTFLSGSVYTQITDVEGEVNGLWTYDRRVIKMDKDQVRAANKAVIELGSITDPAAASRGGVNGLAYWAMDEGEGATSEDLTRYDHTLNLGEGVTWGDREDGHTLEFAGPGSAEADVPEFDAAGSFTVSAWGRLDALPDGRYATFVSADGKAGASSFFLQYGDPIKGFALASAHSQERAVAKMVPEVGVWYHLVGVRDIANREMRIYVNGELMGTATVDGNAMSTGRIAVGRGQWDGKHVDFLTGAVDNAHLWDRALSDEEIAALYNGTELVADAAIEVDPSEVAAGAQVDVEGTGFAPGEPVTLELHSDPVTFGEAQANADGSFTATVTVPADTQPGDHEVLARQGDKTATAPLRVTAAGEPTQPGDSGQPAKPDKPAKPGRLPATGAAGRAGIIVLAGAAATLRRRG